MEFFDKLGKKASEAYKMTADKTGKIAKETKIKLKIGELRTQVNDVYEEISGHSDIFYCKLQNKIICAPNAPIREKEFIVGKNLVGRTYPYDVSYNACQIGDFIIGSKYSERTAKFATALAVT